MVRRVFLAFLVSGLVACGDDSTGLEEIAGTYTLRSIGGEELPAVVDEVGIVLAEVTAGSVTLDVDGTCTSSFTTRREMVDGTVTTTTDPGVCTYTFNDGAVALSFPDGSSSTAGSISGSTLSVTLGGTVFIFQK